VAAPREQVHRAFLAARLGKVAWHSSVRNRPLEVDLHLPLPDRLRVYAYVMGHSPGGRHNNEHSISIRIPPRPGCEGKYRSFDHSDDRIVILAGYREDLDVWALWDAVQYTTLSIASNQQVLGDSVIAALAGGVHVQRRPRKRSEVVLTCLSEYLGEALAKRVDIAVDGHESQS